MISNPTDDEKYLIFKALVRMIEINSGTGFHNLDQGHPAYRLGAIGEPDSVAEGEATEKSALFQLLKSFDQWFHDEGSDLSTWEKFCAFAVASYDRSRGY